MARQLIVSLHDVTPVHAARLDRAEALLRTLDVPDVTYLFVPRFHGVPAEEDAAFLAWCHAERPFRVHWMLHGYWHRESREDRARGGAWWKRQLLTGGEGEFLALHGDALHDRLARGADVFRRCLGRDPEGFVPPAWLAHPTLAATLRDRGFVYTEDHQQLYELPHQRTLPAPVITWATRTVIRRVGSRVVCPLLHARWRTQPLLRIALHPHDFDHAETVDNITRVLRDALRDRDAIDLPRAFTAPPTAPV